MEESHGDGGLKCVNYAREIRLSLSEDRSYESERSRQFIFRRSKADLRLKDARCNPGQMAFATQQVLSCMQISIDFHSSHLIALMACTVAIQQIMGLGRPRAVSTDTHNTRRIAKSDLFSPQSVPRVSFVIPLFDGCPSRACKSNRYSRHLFDACLTITGSDKWGNVTINMIREEMVEACIHII